MLAILFPAQNQIEQMEKSRQNPKNTLNSRAKSNYSEK